MREALGDDLARGLLVLELRLLREVSDFGAAAFRDRADVGGLDAGDDARERALAGAVDADEADALAGADRQRHAVENGVRPERLRDVLNGENRHSGKTRQARARWNDSSF